MNVGHGMGGERHIETVHPDHTRVVSWARHAGYVERPLRPGYVSRTYLAGTRTYVHVYRAYVYRGVTYYRYVPGVYYGRRFYGWAWNPWPAAAVFAWRWRGTPWFDYYAGYFAPAPAYPTAALWLTDYLLAENLQRAYAEQDGPPPATSPGGNLLTPEVKDQIADEVRLQIGAEYAAANQTASQPAPAADQTPVGLDPNQRIFVVSTPLTVNEGTGECGLTPGDVIARTNYTTISARNTVSVKVLASKPGDCPVNSAAEVDLTALQEMHNQFLEVVDNGLRMLAESQSKDGLPAGPPAEMRQAAEGQAAPDSFDSVDSALAEQQQEANQALQEIRQPGSGG